MAFVLFISDSNQSPDMQEILGSIALWPAQQILSSLIATDPHVRKSLNQFSGKAIQVAISQPAFNVCLIFDEDNIRLNSLDAVAHALPVDAVIKGSLQELLRLLFDKSSSVSLVAADIEISGDTQLVQDIFNTMNRLDLEWGDYLAPFIGDMATQELDRAAKNSEQWFQQARTNVHRNVDEYLKEEVSLFPHRNDLNNFTEGVDNLRLRIDRLQARLEALNERLPKQP